MLFLLSVLISVYHRLYSTIFQFWNFVIFWTCILFKSTKQSCMCQIHKYNLQWRIIACGALHDYMASFKERLTNNIMSHCFYTDSSLLPCCAFFCLTFPIHTLLAFFFFPSWHFLFFSYISLHLPTTISQIFCFRPHSTPVFWVPCSPYPVSSLPWHEMAFSSPFWPMSAKGRPP